MKKLFVGIIFLGLINICAEEVNTNIGFKGIYLEEDGQKACATLIKKFPNEQVFIDQKKVTKDIYTSQDAGCHTKNMNIYLNEENKVYKITAKEAAFDIEKMPSDEFIKLILENFKWIPKVDFNNTLGAPYEYYGYKDEYNLGFEVRIYPPNPLGQYNSISLTKIKTYKNKPNFN